MAILVWSCWPFTMPGRRSSAGRARPSGAPRRQSASEIQWRQATATEVVEKGGLEVSGGNGYIDPHKAIAKLKKHGSGLWAMQALVAFVMSVIAVIAGESKKEGLLESGGAVVKLLVWLLRSRSELFCVS